MEGKLESLTVEEYNNDIQNSETFSYLDNHRLQGNIVLVAPFFVKEETEEGLMITDEEEYFEEETFRKKTKPRAKKLTTEKAVVVKISDKVRKDMETQGFDFKEGDVVFLSLPSDAFSIMRKEYKTRRETVSYDEEDHYLIKVVLPEIEAVLEK